MKRLHAAKVIALCVCSLPCACQNPVDQARKVLARELAVRRANREKSMELYSRGLRAYRASDLDRARRYLTDAVTVNDHNACAWMALGAVEFHRDRFFQAASAFHRAAMLEPTRYEPHFNIGTILESVGRYAQAIEAYRTALKLAPGQIEVMENLARCYVRSNTRLDEARGLIDKAIQSERRPAWRMWLAGQAAALRAKGDHEP